MADSQLSGSDGSLLHLVEKLHEILASILNKEDLSLLLSYEEASRSSGEPPALLLPRNFQDLTDAEGKHGRCSAIHLAAACGQRKVVEWLISSRGAYLNLQDEDGFTPLHLAVAFEQKEVARFLVSQRADLFILDKNDMFPFSFCKDSAILDALLSSYSWWTPQRVHLADARKRTILHYVAEYGSDPAVACRIIVEANPDHVYQKDEHGDSFLHIAAKSGNMKVLEALKALDFDMARLLNNGERDCVNSPGMYALLYDHAEFFNELVSMGKVEITLSCIIKALIAQLIDKPEIESRLALFAGTLPTYLALYAKKNCIFNFLLETNLLSLSQWDDEHNRTCLHWAVVDGRTDIVQKLCDDAKHWPGIQDKDGKTAMHHAFEQKNHMVMQVLSEKRMFKEHEEKLNRDREVYVQALNAILVGAALIASVTFAGWLQLPFQAEFASFAMNVYWASNSLSFFTAVATLCVTLTALLPTPGKYLGDIVNQLRVAIVIDAGLLALSLAAVVWAFVAAGFAALQHAHIFAYQVIMRSTTAVGGCLCLIMWLVYVVRLFQCLPSKSVLCALVLCRLPHGFLERHWMPARLHNLRVHVGESSRFGYVNVEKGAFKAIMGNDLVAYRAGQLSPISQVPPASNIISLATMKGILSELDISDENKFLDKIYEQRGAETASKQKRGEKSTRGACRYGKTMVSHAAAQQADSMS